MLITNIQTTQGMLRTLARISGYGTGPLEHLEKSEKQPASCSSCCTEEHPFCPGPER